MTLKSGRYTAKEIFKEAKIDTTDFGSASANIGGLPVNELDYVVRLKPGNVSVNFGDKSGKITVEEVDEEVISKGARSLDQAE